MDTPTISEVQTLGRREFQRRLMERLKEMLDAVLEGSYDNPLIFDHELESFSIRKLSPLNVDEEQPLDLEPVFFRPYPLPPDNDVRALVENRQTDETPTTWHLCPKFGRKRRRCNNGYCAWFRMQWINRAVGYDWEGLLSDTLWTRGYR